LNFLDEGREERMRAHELHLQSDAYQAQLTRLGRLTQGMISLVWLSHAHSSRFPEFVDNFLMYAGTDDMLESLVAVHTLVEQGTLNVARRECRYMLEQSVKHLYVDQKNPTLQVDRIQRQEYLKSEVPRSSIEPIRDVHVLLPEDEQDLFRDQVKSLWSQLSGYVHPSREQLAERAARARRGSFSGFVTSRELSGINDQLAAAYDMLGVLWLSAAGPSTAGDIVVVEDTEQWVFKRSRWLQRLSRTYDYKAERQPGWSQ
jgi:hypothetical protein